jgi:hypothetical protein
MYRRLVFVRTGIWKESIDSMIRVKIISWLGTTLAVTSYYSALRSSTDYMEMEVIHWDTRELLVTAKVVPSLTIFFSLMMEVTSCSVMLVLKKPHGLTSQKMEFFSNLWL